MILNRPPPNGAGSDVLNAFESSPGANLIISRLLSTGFPIIDVLIAIMLPFVLRAIFSVSYSLSMKLYKYLFSSQPEGVERIIDYENTLSIYGYSMNEGDYTSNGRNEILQKAISMFIGMRRREEVTKFQKARVNLLAVKEDADFDYDSRTHNYGSTSEQLQAYKLASVPIWDEWMEIEPGLLFFQTKKGSSGENNPIPQSNDSSSNSTKQFQTTRIQYKLKSTNKNYEKGEKQISRFLQEAYDWYILQMKATEIGARYFYTPILDEPAPDSSANRSGNQNKKKKKYQRYKLSEEKTFQSLFFPGKDKLLSILDTFAAKQGKYQISGFPHKLGLMLYGPPGTGKTSTIKAIANRLNRSIVNIPLARIKTNQQLMDLIYDGIYEVGEDVPVKLGLQDVVYVIEDIDCTSRVVHSRKKKKAAKAAAIASQIPPSSALTRSISAQTNDGVAETDDDFLENATPDDLKKAIASLLDQQKKGPQNDPNPIEASKNDSSSLGFRLRKFYEEPDALNLSGILNAIDGVVDSPGRVIIITTNHPEKLDEALIRPGRIDQVVHLGYIKYEQIVQMLTHYYIEKPSCNPLPKPKDDTDSVSTIDSTFKKEIGLSRSIPIDLLNRIRACFPSDQTPNTTQYINRTPAEIECKCAECDTIEEFVDSLEKDNGTSRSNFDLWE